MSEMKTSFCRICEAGCGIRVEVEDNRVLAIEPDPDHPVSRGYACIKGIRYADVHHSPDRVRHPMRRVGTRWERATWDEALADIGARVARIRDEHGPHAVGLYYGNPVAFSSTHPFFAHGFAKGLRTRNVWGASSQDCSNKFAVTARMYGSAALQPIPDIDSTQCLIILGSNPAVSHMSFVSVPRPIERLRDIEKRGGRVFIVDPRRNETARVLGTHVPIRPDTDVFFLLSFLHEVLKRGALDRPRIERYMRGLLGLRAACEAWTPERTEEVTGVTPAALREMVDAFVAADGASIYASTGLNQGSEGSLAFWLVNAINAITGNLDREGGALVQRGIVDVARIIKKLGFGEGGERSRIGGFEPVLDTLPAALIPDEIMTPGEGQVRAMFVSAGNPVLSCPDESRMREALSRLELLVAIDMFQSETASLAHWILPAKSFLERPDMPLSIHGFQPTPFLQYAPTVVEAAHEEKEEWWIFAELARAAGVPLFGLRAAGVVVALRSLLERAGVPGVPRDSSLALEGLARIAGTSLAALRAHASGILLAPNRGDSFLGKRVLTPDGLVDLAPADLVARARTELPVAFERAQRGRGLLRMISKREHLGHNSWMHNVESFVDKQPKGNAVWLNPLDAERAGLSEGDLAEVATELASVRLPVRITADLMAGAVAMPHGWGHAGAGLSQVQRAPGVNVNRLASSGPHAIESISGMAHLNGVAVRVERVSATVEESASRDAAAR